MADITGAGGVSAGWPAERLSPTAAAAHSPSAAGAAARAPEQLPALASAALRQIGQATPAERERLGEAVALELRSAGDDFDMVRELLAIRRGMSQTADPPGPWRPAMLGDDAAGSVTGHAGRALPGFSPPFGELPLPPQDAVPIGELPLPFPGTIQTIGVLDTGNSFPWEGHPPDIALPARPDAVAALLDWLQQSRMDSLARWTDRLDLEGVVANGAPPETESLRTARQECDDADLRVLGSQRALLRVLGEVIKAPERQAESERAMAFCALRASVGELLRDEAYASLDETMHADRTHAPSTQERQAELTQKFQALINPWDRQTMAWLCRTVIQRGDGLSVQRAAQQQWGQPGESGAMVWQMQELLNVAMIAYRTGAMHAAADPAAGDAQGRDEPAFTDHAEMFREALQGRVRTEYAAAAGHLVEPLSTAIRDLRHAAEVSGMAVDGNLLNVAGAVEGGLERAALVYQQARDAVWPVDPFQVQADASLPAAQALSPLRAAQALLASADETLAGAVTQLRELAGFQPSAGTSLSPVEQGVVDGARQTLARLSERGVAGNRPLRPYLADTVLQQISAGASLDHSPGWVAFRFFGNDAMANAFLERLPSWIMPES